MLFFSPVIELPPRRISTSSILIHVVRSHECQSDIKSLPAERKKIQLYDAKIISRANRSVLKAAEGEECQFESYDRKIGEWPGEASLVC